MEDFYWKYNQYLLLEAEIVTVNQCPVSATNYSVFIKDKKKILSTYSKRTKLASNYGHTEVAANKFSDLWGQTYWLLFFCKS